MKTQQRGSGRIEEENIFLANRPKITLEDYLGYNCSGRGNLDEDIPVFVYRMLEYTLKEILSETYGKDVQVELFRRAGFKAGTFFARKVLDTGLEFNAFVAQLQQKCLSGFSYGCVEIAEGTKSIRLEEILQKADAEMYQQKRIRKAEYTNLLK